MVKDLILWNDGFHSTSPRWILFGRHCSILCQVHSYPYMSLLWLALISNFDN